MPTTSRTKPPGMGWANWIVEGTCGAREAPLRFLPTLLFTPSSCTGDAPLLSASPQGKGKRQNHFISKWGDPPAAKAWSKWDLRVVLDTTITCLTAARALHMVSNPRYTSVTKFCFLHRNFSIGVHSKEQGWNAVSSIFHIPPPKHF